MSIAEREITKGTYIPKEKVTSETDLKEGRSNTYVSAEINSFSQAVDEIVFSDEGDSLCMIDFDNTITGKGVRQVRNPEVEVGVRESFPVLARNLKKGAVCVSTNRTDGSGSLDRAVFKTDKANRVLNSFLEDLNLSSSVKVFRNLNKQIANYPRGDRELLVEHFVKHIKENNIKGRVKLFMVEDDSILALDRSVFPKEVAKKIRKRVREETGRVIGVDVVDFVLKR